MKTGYFLTLLAATCLMAPVFFSGCNPASSTATKDGHDHHDHANDLPAHGPKGGHLFRLEGSDMIAEWHHYNKNDIIRVYLLDAEMKNAVQVDGVTMTPLAGDDRTPFGLEVDPEENKEGLKVVYMLDDKQLNLATSLGLDVEFKMGDKTLKGTIEAHAPHDH